MRDHLATLIDDFRRLDREVAVVRYQGNRRRVTRYGELASLAGRFAALLVARKIGSGDRVIIWGENSAEWIAAFYGCMLRGVLAVPLDSNGTGEFAARVAADVDPKLILGDLQLLAKVAAVADGHSDGDRVANGHTFPTLAFEELHDELPSIEAGPIPTLGNDTPLQILFTSGTTGDPKGIVLTHGNVLASIGPIEDGAKPYMRWERLIHPLRILHTLPLSHVFGQAMGLWVPSILRAELHFESRLAAPRLLEMIRTERISVLAAVPRVLSLLKTHLEATHEGLGERAAATKPEKLEGLRRWWRFRKVHREFGLKFWAFVCGGGAMPAQLEQFWNALGFVLIQGYGMTETTAIITLNHPFHVASGTIGKPLAGREVKLGPDGEVLVRGASISRATWQDGALKPRDEEWLATGDIAERAPSGELRFLGRKSEVIVTAAGLNLHPEDIEAAIETQPEVAACAVVPMQTEAGPEPCAVLAFRGSGGQAAAVIEHANARLPEFQRVSRWVLWPEPDLPRTSTGKVKRKPVAAWLARTQATGGTASNGSGNHTHNGAGHHASLNGHHVNGASGPSSDWLLALIAQISGETPSDAGDEQRLTEDFHLDSLGRVQLSAAIEERLGIVESNDLLEQVQTLGDLRKLVAGGALSANEKDEAEAEVREQSPEIRDLGRSSAQAAAVPSRSSGALQVQVNAEQSAAPQDANVTPPSTRNFALPTATTVTDELLAQITSRRRRFVYPMWAWRKPVQALRWLFIECIMRPLTWFLANPQVVMTGKPLPNDLNEPMLIVANHITAYDGPLLEYALPAPLRSHIAVAMSGEMLEAFRHWRNPKHLPLDGGFYIFGWPAWFLVTTLFNVFPLASTRDFQTSFSHAGKALDRGYSVLVFPEGARSPGGKIARFRPGIGLLVKQSSAPVLPMALRGLGELKLQKEGWFRTGDIEVVVGEPITFRPEDSEATITARLQQEVEKLMDSAADRVEAPEPVASSR